LALIFFAILAYFATVTSVASYPFYRFRSILEPTMITTVTVALGSFGSRRKLRVD
jgi:hypothetical protein